MHEFDETIIRAFEVKYAHTSTPDIILKCLPYQKKILEKKLALMDGFGL